MQLPHCELGRRKGHFPFEPHECTLSTVIYSVDSAECWFCSALTHFHAYDIPTWKWSRDFSRSPFSLAQVAAYRDCVLLKGTTAVLVFLHRQSRRSNVFTHFLIANAECFLNLFDLLLLWFIHSYRYPSFHFLSCWTSQGSGCIYPSMHWGRGRLPQG